MALGSINEFFSEERDPLYRRGYAKGLEKARKERKREMALKLKNMGVEINMIVNFTELSIEGIEKL